MDTNSEAQTVPKVTWYGSLNGKCPRIKYSALGPLIGGTVWRRELWNFGEVGFVGGNASCRWAMMEPSGTIAQ